MPDTYTTKLNLTKPEVNASRDTWGNKWNDNLDALDVIVGTLQDEALVATGDQSFGGVKTFTSTPRVKLGGDDPSDIVTKATLATFLSALLNAQEPIGTIKYLYALPSVLPPGWKVCNGADGTPNFANAFIRCANGSIAHGAYGGSETHNHGGATAATALAVEHLPPHSHHVNDPGHSHGVADPGHNHGYDAPGGGGLLAPGAINTRYGAQGAGTGHSGTGIWIYGSGTGIWLSNTGSGSGHSHGIGAANHLPPWIAVYPIIKVANITVTL